jgi:hypothetical protein
MTEIVRPHPRLPFITLTVDRPTEAEIAEAREWWEQHDDGEEYFTRPDLKASADIEGNDLEQILR